MMVDHYRTINDPTLGEYKEKGSKFLAFAYPFDDELLLQTILDDLHHAHPKARHYCFAYKLGVDDNKYRINDDGEPSGTAGKPIFGQLLSFGLTNILVVVVRYFGGTKLGVPGLIHAYKEATKSALESAEIVEKYLYSQFTLIVDFDKLGQTMNVLNKYPIQFLDQQFDEKCTLNIQIRMSQAQEWVKGFMGEILGRSPQDITGSESMEGIIITPLHLD